MFIEINMVHSFALLIKNNHIYYCTVVFFSAFYVLVLGFYLASGYNYLYAVLMYSYMRNFIILFLNMFQHK
jgi:hypothetical protein